MPRGILPKSEVVVVMVCEWAGVGGAVSGGGGGGIACLLKSLLYYRKKLCDYPTPVSNT